MNHRAALSASLIALTSLFVLTNPAVAQPVAGEWLELGRTPRDGHSIVYDPLGQQYLLFGGATDDQRFRNDVWRMQLNGSGVWEPLLTVGDRPVATFGGKAIYDPARGRLVVSGGLRERTPQDQVCNTFYSRETWALPLSGEPRWVKLASDAPQLSGFALVYDSGRDRLLQHGGASRCSLCGSATDKVWTLDLATPGASWTELTVPPPIGMPAPRARQGHAATYDPVLDRVLILAGFTGGCFTDPILDTWSLRLAPSPAWEPLVIDGTPPSNVIFWEGFQDSPRSRVVLVGGIDRAIVRLLDLSTTTPSWIAPPSASGAPLLSSVGGAAFSVDRNELLVDDAGVTSRLPDVGTGNAWARLDSMPHPGGRSLFAHAFDTSRRQLVVFSGLSLDQQTWALSTEPTGHWERLLPSGTRPEERYGASAIYDPVRDRVIVYGGVVPTVAGEDLWALERTPVLRWTPLTAANAPTFGRLFHTAVYDPAHDAMIVYGGFDGFSTTLGDAWSLSLSEPMTWTRLTDHGTTAPARQKHTAIFDVPRQRMITFGGSAGGPATNDVWQLDLTGPPTWSPLVGQGTPPPAVVSPLSGFDSSTHRMIVHGGFPSSSDNALDRLWALQLDSPEQWVELIPQEGGPSGRAEHAGAYDPAGDAWVFYGGRTGKNASSSAVDAWLLGLEDITTPALLGAVSATAQTGRVRLEWYVSEPVEVRIDRRDPGLDWVERTRVIASEGLNVFEDHDVLAGTSYDYRIVIEENGVDVTSEEVHVQVPPAAEAVFGISRVQPNPATAWFDVVLSLPSGSGTLELIDVRGSVRARVPVNAPGSETFVVRLDVPSDVGPGVYWVRAQSGEKQSLRKVAVLRP